jgi:hypothetical protein
VISTQLAFLWGRKKVSRNNTGRNKVGRKKLSCKNIGRKKTPDSYQGVALAIPSPPLNQMPL